jgi:hypothetical protein
MKDKVQVTEIAMYQQKKKFKEIEAVYYRREAVEKWLKDKQRTLE